MLTNPALAKVVFYNCDVFSTLDIKLKDDKNSSKDPLIKLLSNPNHFQTKRQFLWMYRFWLMFGTSTLLPYSDRLESNNQTLYWLEQTKIKWDSKLVEKLDQFILSKKTKRDLLDQEVKYEFNDGTSKPIKLGELVFFHDLANGVGNWFQGSSRIDALYKVLENSNLSLSAKNINLEFAGKFLVSGNYDPTANLGSTRNMQDVEKEGIVSKILGRNKVIPSKAEVNIIRFVEDLAKLNLDEAFNSDLARIGSMFSIPQDVLEALKEGATYENQEKSTARHIAYSETPKALDLISGLCNHFDLDPENYEVSFLNNQFMKVFEKDEAETNHKKAKTHEILVKNGANPQEAADLLGINLTFKNNGSQSE